MDVSVKKDETPIIQMLKSINDLLGQTREVTACITEQKISVFYTYLKENWQPNIYERNFDF